MCIIKMAHNSAQPRDWIFVTYRFLSFGKNMGTNIDTKYKQKSKQKI